MKKVILLGGGASIKEGIDKGLWDKIKSQEIWSLNYAFMTMPYLPKRELWVDKNFFKNNIEALQKLAEQNVMMITRQNIASAFIEKIIQYLSTRESKNYRGKQALEKSPLIFIGRQGFVGTFALSLAIAEHYDEIYLLGYDYGTLNLNQKITHYYQGKLNIKSTGMGRPERYLMPNGKIKREVTDYEVFSREDINIYNVSMNSNIPYFPKITYEQFFNQIT